MKKRLRKIRTIFDIENWLWKSDFGTFWQLAFNPKLNNFLWVCWFLCKNLSTFVPPFENSTTRIAIFHSISCDSKKYSCCLRLLRSLDLCQAVNSSPQSNSKSELSEFDIFTAMCRSKMEVASIGRSVWHKMLPLASFCFSFSFFSS